MSTPPRLAAALLRWACSPETLQEAEGDLAEAFVIWAAARGTGFARRRYWKEVVQLLGWRVVRGWRRLRDGPAGPREPLLNVRYGLRRVLKHPASSVVSVLLLAIGIGGNATVFTVVDRVFRKPPPLIQDPGELVGLDWVMGGAIGAEFGYYDFEFYRDHGGFFDDVLAYGGFPGTRGRRTDEGGGEVTVGPDGALDQAGAWVVSRNYFRTLGISMERGGGFSPGVRAGEPDLPEVVLSHGYWLRSLGGDPEVLDRPIYLNGVAFRVAGVTPRSFRGVNPREPLPDLFIPVLSADLISFGFRDQLRRFGEDGSPSASRFLRLVARLKPGIDLSEAQAGMDVLQARWEAEFGSWAQAVYGESYGVRVRSDFSLAPYESQLLKRQLYFLWLVVGAVFLIACTNLALLLLAGTAGRKREMGIRASVGAGRRQLLAQLVTESLILSVLGGLVGLSLAWVGTGVIEASLAMPAAAALRPDGSVVAFTFLLAALAVVLFGTAPAWQLSRMDLTALLQRPGQERVRVWFRGGLVVGQTALSMLLLIGGGLLARSIQEVQEIDLGFEPDDALVMSVVLDNQGYTEERGPAFVQEALDRLARVPGVRSATTCDRLPFLGSNTWTFTAPGTDYAEVGMRSGLNLVGPGYLETMGMDLVSGRPLNWDDVPEGERVVVVNERFAREVWPGADPLGRTLDFFDGQYRVVGVAGDAVYYSVTEQPQPMAFFSSLQIYQGRQNFIVATESTPATMVAAVEDALRELDPHLAVAPLTLRSLVDEQVSSYRVWAALLGAFAGMALFLALVGLYGVQSYLVSTRTREFGIRIALGAESGGVVGAVVRSGLLMGGLGVLTGLGAALVLTRFMQGVLFGVAPTDPLVFVAVPLLLLATCAAASLIPALRAGRLNPVEALRRE